MTDKLTVEKLNGYIGDQVRMEMSKVPDSIKQDVKSTIDSALQEFQKSGDYGVLREQMTKLTDNVEEYNAEISALRTEVQATNSKVRTYANKRDVYDAYDSIGQRLRETTLAGKRGEESRIELAVQDGSVSNRMLFDITGNGIQQGAQRPVLPTDRFRRNLSAISQAMPGFSVGGPNFVVPWLASSSGGIPSGLAGFGYFGTSQSPPAQGGNPNNGTFQANNSLINERTYALSHYEGTYFTSMDSIRDNTTLMAAVMDDLLDAGFAVRAQALATGTGTAQSGAGNNGTVIGLFNLGAVPSTLTAANVGVGSQGSAAVTIARVEFPGASVAAALGGGGTNITATNSTGTNATWQKFLDVIGAMPPVYRRDLCWILSSEARTAISKLVDATGRPLYKDMYGAGNMDLSVTGYSRYPDAIGMFLDLPVYEEAYAPLFSSGTTVGNVTTNARFGVLASMSKSYRIYDNYLPTIEVYNQTVPGYLTFYLQGRVQGYVHDPLAIVALEFSGPFA